MVINMPVPNTIKFCRLLPIYWDSQPDIDSLNANTVTSRVKHIVVPIFMYMQEPGTSQGWHHHSVQNWYKPEPS